MNPNVSRSYRTPGNTFHVNPHVAERLYDRYISALSQVHNAPTEHSSPYLPSPVTSLQLQSLIAVSFWASRIPEEGKYHEFSLALCPQEFTTIPASVFHPGRGCRSYLLVLSSDESYRLMDRLKPHWWRDLLRHLDLKKTLSAFGSMNMANYSSGDLPHQREYRWQLEFALL